MKGVILRVTKKRMPSSSASLFSNKKILYAALALILLGAAWLVYANYQKRMQILHDEAARRAAAETAKSQNPFQSKNPLSGVEANPFEKAKKVMNPFEN